VLVIHRRLSVCQRCWYPRRPNKVVVCGSHPTKAGHQQCNADGAAPSANTRCTPSVSQAKPRVAAPCGAVRFSRHVRAVSCRAACGRLPLCHHPAVRAKTCGGHTNERDPMRPLACDGWATVPTLLAGVHIGNCGSLSWRSLVNTCIT
jgi:hypothetical protein